MKTNTLLFMQLAIIGCTTYFVHELAHLFAHLFLGHSVDFKINHMDLIHPKIISDSWKQALVSGSGVGFTFLQAAIAYLMLKKYRIIFWWNVLLSAFVLRFAATLLGFVTSSDEIKTSIALGLPSYFLTLVTMTGFLFFIYRAKKQLNHSNKTILSHCLILLGVIYLFSLI